jgi:hypothetical protein
VAANTTQAQLDERLMIAEQGAKHRVARRSSNERKAAGTRGTADEQKLVEFDCECMSSECDRSVSVPLYVYRRLVEAGDQYLVQAAHHAFPRHRTIVSFGLMRIEERA